jgi:hypothetical protein
MMDAHLISDADRALFGLASKQAQPEQPHGERGKSL